MRRLPLVLAVLMVTSVLSACVTEVQRPKGRGTRLGTEQAAREQPGVPTPTPGAADASARVEQDDPSSAARRTSSRVQVAIVPLGSIEYDGFSLPIVSPDGGYLAVQVGDAPQWGTVLGDASRETPPEGGVRILTRGERSYSPVGKDRLGLLLGRDATASGVLVERVGAMDDRRIGLLPWNGGEVRWLTPTNQRCGHGAILRHPFLGDGLVHVRWDDDQTSTLCAIGIDREWRAEVPLPAGIRASFPTPSLDGSGVVLFVTSARGVFARGVPLSVGEAAVAWAAPTWGREIAPAGDEEGERFAPYQAVAGLQPGAWNAGREGEAAGDWIVLAHTGKARLWRVSIGSAEGEFLPSDAIAAARWEGGWFLTREDDLAYVDTLSEGVTPARVIADSFVPRVVGPRGTMPRRLLLLGPSAEAPDRLNLVDLVPGAAPGKAP